MAGRNEGLVVRLTGTSGQAVFASVPGSWEATGFEVASVRLPDGTVFEVGKSSEARADILARFRARAALAFLAVVLLGGAGGALLTRKALAPLRRLRAVLGSIVRTGQVSARVPVRADGDPLDDLGRLANEMLDRIEALIAGMKGSLDNVAHDLRTPLQRLRATAESALRENDAEGGACRPGGVHRGVRPRGRHPHGAHGHLGGRDGYHGPPPGSPGAPWPSSARRPSSTR